MCTMLIVLQNKFQNAVPALWWDTTCTQGCWLPLGGFSSEINVKCPVYIGQASVVLIWCSTVHCIAVQYTVLYYSMRPLYLFSVVQCSFMHCNAVQCINFNVILRILRSKTSQNSCPSLSQVKSVTVLYCTVLYFTVLYYTVLYFTVLYCTIWYSSDLTQLVCSGRMLLR